MGRAPALILVLVAGCGGGNPGADANEIPIDAKPDPTADANLVDFAFKGSFLDWDSSGSSPCGIKGAKWGARYDDHRVALTDAAGEFMIPLASYTPLLDVTLPTAASACSNPGSTYAIKVIAIATPAVFYAGGAFTARTLTVARATTFYAGFGATFDPSRGAVLVHINGPARTVSISTPSGSAQGFSGTAWAGGASGIDVFFPNIDLAGNVTQTTVTIAGGALGTGSVPLEPGTITAMAVITN